MSGSNGVDLWVWAFLLLVIAGVILFSYKRIGGCLVATVVIWIVIILSVSLAVISFYQIPTCFTVWSGSCT